VSGVALRSFGDRREERDQHQDEDAQQFEYLPFGNLDVVGRCRVVAIEVTSRTGSRANLSISGRTVVIWCGAFGSAALR
jgi:hypothetical protein